MFFFKVMNLLESFSAKGRIGARKLNTLRKCRAKVMPARAHTSVSSWEKPGEPPRPRGEQSDRVDVLGDIHPLLHSRPQEALPDVPIASGG